MEYCRDKWQQAREKNTNTEREWFELRTEFSSRKKLVADIANDSPESGYSEDRDSLTEEEEDVEEQPRKRSLVEVIQSEIEEIEGVKGEEVAGCSGKSRLFSEEFLQAKDERLKRLEEEAKSLMTKVTETSNKSANMCNKLESLHETYGSKSQED